MISLQDRHHHPRPLDYSCYLELIELVIILKPGTDCVFFLIVFGYSLNDVRGSSHAPPASSSIGVVSDVLNMDAATPGGSATAESDIISDKFLVTPLKTINGYLSGESCDPCSPWFGRFVSVVVLIRLNVSTVPESNEYKYTLEIPTGTPSKYPADASTCSWF